MRVEVRYSEDGQATVFYQDDDVFGFFDLQDIVAHQREKGYSTLEEAVASYAFMSGRPRRKVIRH